MTKQFNLYHNIIISSNESSIYVLMILITLKIQNLSYESPKSGTKNIKDVFWFWMILVAKLTNQRPVLMKLRLRKNNIIADKNRRNFLRIFLGFSRGLLIKARRSTYRSYNSVLWEVQKKIIIQNQNMSLDFPDHFELLFRKIDQFCAFKKVG